MVCNQPGVRRETSFTPRIWQSTFTLRDGVVALTLANLVFFKVWARIIGTFGGGYEGRTPTRPVEYYAAILSVLAITLALWTSVAVIRALHRDPAAGLPRLAFGCLILVLDFGITTTLATGSYLLGAVLAITLASPAAAIALLPSAARRIARAVPVLLLTVPLTFGQALWKAATYDGRQWLDPPAPARVSAGKSAAPRLLWLIFDEWDRDLTFVHRPHSLRLPEMDRFRESAFFATECYPAAGETLLAMPSLISGRRAVTYDPRGPAQLFLRFQDSPQVVSWQMLPSIFGAARAAGSDTAVVGTAHPYCRVLGKDVSDCQWWPIAELPQAGLVETALRQIRELFETQFRSPFGHTIGDLGSIHVYEEVMREAERVSADRTLGLTLVHFQVPHPPYFYDPATGGYDWRGRPVVSMFAKSQSGYLEALELVDRSFGRLRRAMERAGTWHGTTILLTTDHHYRHRLALDGQPVDPKIPFLLRLAGQKEPVSYNRPFNAVVTHDLLLAILRGEVTGVPELTAFLDQRCEKTVTESRPGK